VPDSLLVIVPAYNEEAAVGGVVHAIHAAMPGTPVLVIDDCSADATHVAAREAGARVLPLPHHLGLGGCVQAGYKLAFELGYQYVIRVDGDGQHDARDIPRVLEALRTSGCEMVIGSRFVNGDAASTGVIRGLGIRFFRMVLRPILGQRVHDPTSGFVGVNRNALQLWWCCSASDSDLWRFPAACIRAPPAARRSRPSVPSITSSMCCSECS
jgi:glycosyltransferase involved in cell wall biosynthesis